MAKNESKVGIRKLPNAECRASRPRHTMNSAIATDSTASELKRNHRGERDGGIRAEFVRLKESTI